MRGLVLLEVVPGVFDGDVALSGGAGDVALEVLVDRQDAQGEVVVAEGETVSDQDLLGMNWYVQGIDDTIPQ